MIEQAIKLNNEAISLLLDGNEIRAELLLKESLAALQHLNRLIHVSKDPTLPPPSVEGTVRAGGNSSNSIVYTISGSASLSNLQTNDDFMFSNLLVLRHSDSNKSKSFLEYISRIYSGCVIMNLALIYHCRAMHNCQYNAFHKRAEFLYDKVLNISLMNDGNNAFDDGTALFLRMAAANNVSFLRSMRGSNERARQDLTVVAVSMQCLNSREISRAVLLSDTEINGFLSNVILLAMNPSAAPAA